MSHVATIKTKLTDLAAITAACKRLGIEAGVEGEHKLYDGTYTGLGVRLQGWKYPVVIDRQSGEVKYDNYNGKWGKQSELDAFMQAYGVEKTKIEARKKGYSVVEKKVGGSIQLSLRK